MAMRRPLWTTERKIVLGFGTTLVALGLVAGLSVWMIFGLLADLRVVAAQNTILTCISEVNGMAPQLATYARLFEGNHNPETFEEWRKEKDEIQAKLQQLDELTGDSPTQRERMKEIRGRLKEKVDATTL